MKLRVISLFILLIVSKHVFTQPSCGTKSLHADERKKLEWIGINWKLIERIREHGYELPSDYFDNLDREGKYRGQRLRIAPNSSSMQSELGSSKLSTHYYIPVKVWMHLGPNGEEPIPLGDISDLFVNANQMYESNGVPISFIFDCNEVEPIPNSPHYIIEDKEEEESFLFGSHVIANHFNLHFVLKARDSAGNKIAGAAQGIPSYRTWISSEASEHTLAHEFGHNLGLLHTHESAPPCLGGNNDSCADCW